MKTNKVGKYLIYAIGEIILIIIGILIAVKINSSVNESKESKLRCQYLNELLYVFNLDIDDVKGNIRAFETWHPKIRSILVAHKSKSLSEVDSLYDKFGTVGNYIKFGQRSLSKIDELKYSDVNLIENRTLKNKILIYQDEKVAWLRHLEVQYEKIGDNLREYYMHHFDDFNYTEAIPIDLKKIENDNYYFSIVMQRLRNSITLQLHYEDMMLLQNEIKQLIEKELELNCTE